MNRKQWSGTVLALVLFVTILMYPKFENLAAGGQRCLALFVAVFILYIFESIPAAIISIAIVPLLVVLEISDVNEALAGFASTSTYLVVGSFILAAAMIKSGLGKRITCHLLLVLGKSPVWISFGFVIVNIIMAFLIPSSTARTAMMLSICLSIIHEFHGEEQSKIKYAANLLLTLCVTSSTISAGIMTSTVSNPMAVEYIKNTADRVVTYGEWFLWGFPPALIMTILSWFVIQLFFRLKESSGEESAYLKQQLMEMGGVSRAEILTSAVIIITVILWVFGSYWGIDSTTAAFIGAVLLFLPMCNVLEWKDCQNNISLSVVFVISGGISLGNAMAKTGASDWLAEQVFGFVSDRFSFTLIILLIIIVVQFMHIFFVGTATMANAFFPILVSIAVKMNVSSLYIIMPAAFMIGGYPVLMFFNTTPNIICYDTGYLKPADFMKTGTVISILACVIYGFCAKWYWPFVGMF